MATFENGETIAYTAKFLKNTGQFTGGAGKRRGVFRSLWDKDPKFARVHWHDADYTCLAEQWGQDYADDAKAHGQLVLAVNICRVGSAKFEHNDL